MVGGPQMVKYLAPSRATASTVEAYKSFRAPTSEAGNLHWQFYTRASSTQSVSAAQTCGYASSRAHLVYAALASGLWTLDEVVCPLLHWIGRRTEE